MDQYNSYLATNVLNDGHIVTYRSLSRALKVHVNLAKQMLYEFHKSQTSKRPKSVHATYLVSGLRQNLPPATNDVGHHMDGDDTVMDSSPFPSSLTETPEQSHLPKSPVKAVTLVREEDLEDLKKQFLEITSIHVYSLQPASPQDMHVLSTVNSEMFKTYGNEDPLVAWKEYGTIQNPNVQRRSKTRQPTISTDSRSQTSHSGPNPSKPTESAQPSPAVTSSTSKPSVPPKLKSSNSGKSDIFSSFAKAKAKTQAQPSNNTKDEKPKDEPMKDIFDDDDGEDEDAADAFPAMDAAKVEASKAARADREAQLRKMMEEDDEDKDAPMTDAAAANAAAEASKDAADKEGDSDDDDDDEAHGEQVENGNALDSKSDQVTAEAAAEGKETATVSGGRRRGRRKVMKKITSKDEEGYLVTTEEAVWESFSEDEPEVKKAKIPAVSSSAGAGAGKKKLSAPAGKKGQGNIMSFFGKKA